MKRLLILWALLVATPLWAADGFLQTLTPEELAATGLQKLSPEELARLAAVVERYKTGEVAVVQQRVEEVRQAAEQKVAVVRQAAEQKVASVRQEAETKIAAAEAKVKQAETKAAEVPAATVATDKKPGWLKALITLDKVAKEPDSNDAIETRFAGDFKGWRRGTVFNLANGQRWQADSSEDYVTPPSPAPKVRIYPGMLGTFWMEIEGVKPRVRVKPIRLE
ncbi:MAG: hypothetical protein PSV13_03220 [Lacunisphaera sp.]|nr:hypothetical protein [Lacunisphaera sp.]